MWTGATQGHDMQDTAVSISPKSQGDILEYGTQSNIVFQLKDCQERSLPTPEIMKQTWQGC